MNSIMDMTEAELDETLSVRRLGRLAALNFDTPPATGGDLFRTGDWCLCERWGWPDNQSCQNILSWCWAKGDERALTRRSGATSPAGFGLSERAGE